MTILVRLITHDDFEAVTALLDELGRPALKDATQQAVEKTFHAHVDDPASFSLLALVNGQAQGFISLEMRERLNWGTLEAWVPDFIVTEAARGTGVGHALFEAAVAIARDHECHRMTLESGYNRTVAHGFYEQHGMQNAGYFFSLNLEAD